MNELHLIVWNIMNVLTNGIDTSPYPLKYLIMYHHYWKTLAFGFCEWISNVYFIFSTPVHPL